MPQFFYARRWNSAMRAGPDVFRVANLAALAETTDLEELRECFSTASGRRDATQTNSPSDS